MTRFYLRTQCWSTAMTSIHVSYPPHSRLTPCLRLRLLTWRLFGKKGDRMWFGQYEWLIVCYKNNSTHTHTWTSSHTPQIRLWRQFCRLPDGDDQTMTRWTSALPSLKVISCKACWEIDWSEGPSNLALTLLWPSTGKKQRKHKLCRYFIQEMGLAE